MNHERKFQEPSSFEELKVLVSYICLCCFIGVGIGRGADEYITEWILWPVYRDCYLF